MPYARLILLSMMVWTVGVSAAQAADPFKGANPEAGRKLIAENGCNGSCHQSYSEDNDPISLFTRPNRKVTSAQALLKQVERCTIRLNSTIFPEDVKDIAAALNQDYYKFK